MSFVAHLVAGNGMKRVVWIVDTDKIVIISIERASEVGELGCAVVGGAILRRVLNFFRTVTSRCVYSVHT